MKRWQVAKYLCNINLQIHWHREYPIWIQNALALPSEARSILYYKIIVNYNDPLIHEQL